MTEHEDDDADPPVSVFISYSHDDEAHKDRVLELAQAIRTEGFDAHIDRFVEHDPPVSWPQWMFRQLRDSERVVVVCTETYQRRAEGDEDPGVGLGASWEGAIVTQDLYEKRENKYIPVVFDSSDRAFIPYFLRGTSNYLVGTEDDEAGEVGDLDPLVGRLRGTPVAVPAPIGGDHAPDLIENEHPRARFARALRDESSGQLPEARDEYLALARDHPEVAGAAHIAAARTMLSLGDFEAALATASQELGGPLDPHASEAVAAIQANIDILSNAQLADLRVRLAPGTSDFSDLRYALHEWGADELLGNVLNDDSLVDPPDGMTGLIVDEVESRWAPRVTSVRATSRTQALVVVEVDATVTGVAHMDRPAAELATASEELTIVGEVNEHTVEVLWTGGAILSVQMTREVAVHRGGFELLA